MLADFPPSSCDTRLTVSAAAFATCTPARVEPVKDTISISGCREIASPTVGPSPSTMLNTPLGRPASSRISAKTCALSGAVSLGFSTTVQPAASAGATLQAIWLIGQFQGVINPQTPIGSRRNCVVPLSSSNLNACKAASVALRCPRPLPACACSANFIGAPISSEIAVANRGMCFLNATMIRSSNAMRSARVVTEKLSKASRAACTAVSTSAPVPSRILPTLASVAGLITSSSRRPLGVTHAPLIKNLLKSYIAPPQGWAARLAAKQERNHTSGSVSAAALSLYMRTGKMRRNASRKGNEGTRHHRRMSVCASDRNCSISARPSRLKSPGTVCLRQAAATPNSTVA